MPHMEVGSTFTFWTTRNVIIININLSWCHAGHVVGRARARGSYENYVSRCVKPSGRTNLSSRDHSQ